MTESVVGRFIRAVVTAEDWAPLNPAVGRTHVAAVLDEVGGADGAALPRFVIEVLRIYERVAAEVYSALGMVALRVALVEIARIDPSEARRDAAELILAFSAMNDLPGGDNELRAVGADAIDPLLIRVADTERWPQVAEAVVSVWAALLPVLHTDEGLALLGLDY